MTPSLATVFAIIFAPLVSLLGLDSLELITHSKDIYIEEGSHLLGFNMYRTNLAYIVCKNLDEFEISCDLTVDTIDDGFLLKSCPNFLIEDREDYIRIKSRVFLFENDRVIVLWASYNRCDRSASLKLYFVLQHGCKVQAKVIKLKSHPSNLSGILENLLMLRTPSGFEMLYNDTCRDVCSVTFDNQGTMLYETRDMNPTGRALGYFVHPAETYLNLLNSGYCFLTRSEERMNATLFFSEDSRKILDSVLSRGINASSIKASTASGVLSLCWQDPEDKKILACTRGNSSAKLELELFDEFQDPIVHNLPESRFLVLTSKTKGLPLYTGRRYFEFSLAAFDARFRLRGHQRFRMNQEVFLDRADCYSKQDAVYIHIFDNHRGYYCVSFFKELGAFRLFVKCFPKRWLFEENL